MRRADRRRFTVNATQILRPGRITGVCAASRDEPNETNRSNHSQKTEQRIVHSFDGVLNAQPAQKVKRGSPFAPSLSFRAKSRNGASGTSDMDGHAARLRRESRETNEFNL